MTWMYDGYTCGSEGNLVTRPSTTASGRGRNVEARLRDDGEPAPAANDEGTIEASIEARNTGSIPLENSAGGEM